MSDMTSLEKKRRLVVLALGIMIGLSVLVLAFSLFFAAEEPSSSARMSPAKSDRVSGQAGGIGSEEYNQKLREHDQRQASEALKSGESFVPTPVGDRKPVVVKKAETPPATPPVAPVRVAPVQPPRTDNTMLKRMQEDLATLDARLAAASTGQGQIVYQRDFSKEAEKISVSDEGQTLATPEKSPVAPVAIRAGDLLYGIIDISVNSDVPSAVLATITSGRYRNARIMGTFQRHDERLVLAFNRIIPSDGEPVQIEAYAVAPGTSEASVASSVDTHFFSHWGGLIASAFLEGLGTAKRYSGSQSTIYGYNGETSDQMVWNTYSVGDQAWIAAGKVGEKAGKIFERGFDRPPTVRLESGTPVGILIVSVKGR